MAWSNVPDLDAMPVASDLPGIMKPGERRYVTIVMRNTGDTTGTEQSHKLGLTFSAAARDFHIEAIVSAQADALTARFGGVARDMSGVYTVLLTSPCTPGVHLVAVEISDAHLGGFGSQLQKEISVGPIGPTVCAGRCYVWLVRALTTDLTKEDCRPYFFWDEDTSIAELRLGLHGSDDGERCRLLGKMLREARDSDVWEFVSPRDVAMALPAVVRHLGRRRAFWEYLIGRWRAHGLVP